MSVFLLLSTAMVLIALGMILRPLLFGPGAGSAKLSVSRAREDLADLRGNLSSGSLSREDFERARTRLALELLETVGPAPDPAAVRGSRSNVAAAAVIAVLVPAAAAALYWKLGASEFLSIPMTAADSGAPVASGDSVPSVEVLLERLEARLAENPEDVQGWEILARSYLQTGRFAAARDAYARLYELVGERGDVQVGYAESLARAADGDLSGRPLELIEAALRTDPNNQQGLWLAGLAAVQRGDNAGAKTYWQRLLALQEPGSESEQTLRTHLAELGARGDDPATQAATATPAASESVETGLNGAAVTASVSLDPSLRERVEADDTLFVYARAANGPRMPIALARHRVSDLPLSVRLDDSMAMMPQLRLSNFADVEVVARISKTGRAAQQSGDLIGTSGAVSVGSAEQVTITISDIVP